MNTLRGERRDARRTGRRRWFAPVTLLAIALAMVGILRAPRSGLDLTEEAPGTLTRSEAAATSVASTTVVSPSIETVAPVPPATAVAAVTPSESIGATELDRYFSAIEAVDLVAAFDHLSPAHQVAVGGFGWFEAVWKAPAAVAHDRPECAADQSAFDCTITFRTYDAEGSCLGAVYAYRLEKAGTRYLIAQERPVAERVCESSASVSGTG